jgi:hypothetical protein
VKIVRALVGVMTLGAAGCGESSDPRSPNNPTTTSGVAGTTDGITPLKIAPPTVVSPADGARLDTRQPTLVVGNPVAAHSAAAVLRVRFLVQDQAGTTLHQSVPIALGTGTTQYTLPIELAHDQSFRWSAVVVWNDTPGAPSAVRSFRTPLPPEPPRPPIEWCDGSDPIDIVTCQRGKTPGTMDEAELLDFINRLAANLNRNGIGGGPFGALRKTAGTSCGGYSCDILCAGQGGGQRQWDVLHDLDGSQAPTWYGPKTGSQIRVDVCEIR